MGCSAAPPASDEPAESDERVESESQQLTVTLQNGWTNAPYGTRKAAVWYDPDTRIVHFSGAVASGTSPVIFTLPQPKYWPDTTTYIPVDLCNAASGRLVIGTDGVVRVQAQHNFSDAQCFTSLEGPRSHRPTLASRRSRS
jgi:hypothetical protein